MSHLFLLTENQLNIMKAFFPKSRGVARVDDLPVISGIIHVIKNDLPWRSALDFYGSYKTLYNRYNRWGGKGIFQNMLIALAFSADPRAQLQMDSTHIKIHRTAASLFSKDTDRAIGRSKGGLNTKIHAVCDQEGNMICFALTNGNTSDYIGADLLMKHLPRALTLLADRGYDSNKIRQALLERNITPCIPPRKNRK